jgi:hypothetical protein
MIQRAAHLLAAMILLSGCAGPVYKTELEIYCPPIKKYSSKFNEQLAQEVLSLPEEGAAIERVVSDYIELRDTIRACNQERDKRNGN